MKTSGMDIRNHKKRGRWAELRFMTKATELGFQLAKPLGDTAQYDVIVDLGGRFINVQVKSTFAGPRPLQKPGRFDLYGIISSAHFSDRGISRAVATCVQVSTKGSSPLARSVATEKLVLSCLRALSHSCIR